MGKSNHICNLFSMILQQKQFLSSPSLICCVMLRSFHNWSFLLSHDNESVVFFLYFVWRRYFFFSLLNFAFCTSRSSSTNSVTCFFAFLTNNFHFIPWIIFSFLHCALQGRFRWFLWFFQWLFLLFFLRLIILLLFSRCFTLGFFLSRSCCVFLNWRSRLFFLLRLTCILFGSSCWCHLRFRSLFFLCVLFLGCFLFVLSNHRNWFLLSNFFDFRYNRCFRLFLWFLVFLWFGLFCECFILTLLLLEIALIGDSKCAIS